MCSAFTPDCGYDNSTNFLIGDVYCPNTNCFGKVNFTCTKRLFNLPAEAIINARNARLCVKFAIFHLKIKQNLFSCRLVLGFTFLKKIQNQFKVASLCGVVCSATCLTGWEYRSRFSVSLIICIVRLVCDWCFVVGVRVCLGITIVVFVSCSTICIVLDLVFFLFELTALILIVTWLFAMLACWFGLFRVLLCVLLHHSI